MKIEHAGNSLVAIDADIPDEVAIETVTQEQLSLLPWCNYPALPDLFAFGDEYPIKRIYLSNEVVALPCFPDLFLDLSSIFPNNK